MSGSDQFKGLELFNTDKRVSDEERVLLNDIVGDNESPYYSALLGLMIVHTLSKTSGKISLYALNDIKALISSYNMMLLSENILSKVGGLSTQMRSEILRCDIDLSPGVVSAFVEVGDEAFCDAYENNVCSDPNSISPDIELGVLKYQDRAYGSMMASHSLSNVENSDCYSSFTDLCNNVQLCSPVISGCLLEVDSEEVEYDYFSEAPLEDPETARPDEVTGQFSIQEHFPSPENPNDKVIALFEGLETFASENSDHEFNIALLKFKAKVIANAFGEEDIKIVHLEEKFKEALVHTENKEFIVQFVDKINEGLEIGLRYIENYVSVELGRMKPLVNEDINSSIALVLPMNLINELDHSSLVDFFSSIAEIEQYISEDEASSFRELVVGIQLKLNELHSNDEDNCNEIVEALKASIIASIDEGSSIPYSGIKNYLRSLHVSLSTSSFGYISEETKYSSIPCVNVLLPKGQKCEFYVEALSNKARIILHGEESCFEINDTFSGQIALGGSIDIDCKGSFLNSSIETGDKGFKGSISAKNIEHARISLVQSGDIHIESEDSIVGSELVSICDNSNGSNEFRVSANLINGCVFSSGDFLKMDCEIMIDSVVRFQETENVDSGFLIEVDEVKNIKFEVTGEGIEVKPQKREIVILNDIEKSDLVLPNGTIISFSSICDETTIRAYSGSITVHYNGNTFMIGENEPFTKFAVGMCIADSETEGE